MLTQASDHFELFKFLIHLAIVAELPQMASTWLK